MTNHYVEFILPGVFYANSRTERVNERNIEQIRAPPECYGFRFFDAEGITKGNEPRVSRRRNYSGFFYFGRTLTLDDVSKEFPEKTLLIRNMESEKWSKVVRTRLGNFLPLGLDDLIIASD